MRRILTQVILLIAFLFLAVFASVWFEDTGGNEAEPVDKNQSFSWFVSAVQKTWQLVDGLAGLASPSLSGTSARDTASTKSVDSQVSEVMAVASELPLDLNAGQMVLEEVNLDSETNFGEFFSNFLQKAPALYFDTKVYSNGWRNFWSLYWLEYKNLRPE